MAPISQCRTPTFRISCFLQAMKQQGHHLSCPNREDTNRAGKRGRRILKRKLGCWKQLGELRKKLELVDIFGGNCIKQKLMGRKDWCKDGNICRQRLMIIKAKEWIKRGWYRYNQPKRRGERRIPGKVYLVYCVTKMPDTAAAVSALVSISSRHPLEFSDLLHVTVQSYSYKVLKLLEKKLTHQQERCISSNILTQLNLNSPTGQRCYGPVDVYNY